MAAQGRGQQPPQVAQDDAGGAGMNRQNCPKVFENDPFVDVYEVFKELFPDKDAEIWWHYEMKDEDGNKVLGVTTFPDDGSLPMIEVDVDQSVNDSIQILAHELSHVATNGHGHGQDFYDAYNAIWQKYHEKLGLEPPKDFELGSEDEEHGEVQE
jgi:hypothetical protein